MRGRSNFSSTFPLQIEIDLSVYIELISITQSKDNTADDNTKSTHEISTKSTQNIIIVCCISQEEIY